MLLTAAEMPTAAETPSLPVETANETTPAPQMIDAVS